MSNFFTYISLISTLLAPLKLLIASAEEAFAGVKGAGAQKLQVVLTAVNETLTAAGTAADQIAAIQTPITAIVNTFVSAFNVLKVFGKGT